MGVGTFLVERYWPGVTESDAAAAVEAARAAAAAMTAEGTEIRCLSSSLFPADEALFIYFEAGSADDVAELNRRAGAPADRISSCVQVPPGGRTT